MLNSNSNQQRGFTLIELVVVIVILGILAVTAAPKFLNLQDDAKISAVKGLAGGMKGAAGIVYGKAAVLGEDRNPDTTISSADGTTVETVYGYPKAGPEGIEAAVDGLPGDWTDMTSELTTLPGANKVAYGFDNFPCVAVYTEAKSDSPAIVEIQKLAGLGNADIQCTSGEDN